MNIFKTSFFSILTLTFLTNISIFTQTNPTAQQVPYSTDFGTLSHTSSTYPSGWIGWRVSSLPGSIYSLSTASANGTLTASGYASNSTKGIYNYKNKLGFLNAADGDYAMVLALKTTGTSNIVIEYSVSTVRNPYDGSSNTRINGLEMQYRVGTSGVFKSLNSRVYANNTTQQTGTTTTEQNKQYFSVTLPADCDNASVVQIRWISREISGTGLYPGFAIDDINASEGGSSVNYYYKGTGNFTSLNSWSTDPNGTGSAPSSFTANNQNFVITNPAAITFTENWTVSGNFSKVIIGSEVNKVDFTTSGSAQLNAVTDIVSGSALIISQTTSSLPVFGNMYPGSAIQILYGASLSNLPAETTYENLLLNSGGGHTYLFNLSSPDILIKGNFEIVNTKLNVNGSDKFKLQTQGDITFSNTASFTSSFSNLCELYLYGSAQQIIKMNGIDLKLNSLTIANSAGINLSSTGGSSNILLSNGTANILKMAGGNITTNGNTIVLGSGTTEPGTLSYSSGFISGTGSLSRWFAKDNLPTTYTYAFPMGAGINDRGISIQFSNSSITSGGMLTVSHTDLPGSVSITPYTDGTLTINKKSNMNWYIVQSNSWNLGTRTVSMRVFADGLEGITDPASLTIVKGSVKPGGTFSSGTGTANSPIVNRIGMSITDIGGTGGTGSTFSIGAGNGNPLPVTITTFTAGSIKRDVVLNWVTSMEINNKGFEIERSKKDISTGSYSQWEKIGFVEGKINSNTETEYIYTDKKLTDGTYKFRIKQVDLNGAFEYFTPQNNTELIVGKPVNFDISQNYPNPSNPVSKIDFQLPFDAKVSIKVYDMTGKEVSILVNGNLTSGFHQTEFNGSNLSSGVYFYMINATGVNGEAFAKTMKMILIK